MRSPSLLLLAALAALLAISEPSLFVGAKPKWLSKVGDALNRVKAKLGKKGEKGECANSAAKVPKGGATTKKAPDAEKAYPAGAAPLPLLEPFS